MGVVEWDKHQKRGGNGMASMEERMATIEATLPHLATKADVKDLEVRLTRLVYAMGVGIIISGVGVIVSIALGLSRLFGG